MPSKSKPSWNTVANTHYAVKSERQRVARRTGCTVFEADGSQGLMRQQADSAPDVICRAANGVRQASKAVAPTCFNGPEGSLGDEKGETLVQSSAESMRAFGAIVDALTATVLNAEAALTWLNAQRSEEVRRTLNMIAKDGKRAGEVVVRLRAHVKGSIRLDDSLDP